MRVAYVGFLLQNAPCPDFGFPYQGFVFLEPWFKLIGAIVN